MSQDAAPAIEPTLRARRAPGAPQTAGAVPRPTVWSVLEALGDLGELVLIAYAFALAVLAIGLPVALLVHVVTLIARAL